MKSVSGYISEDVGEGTVRVGAGVALASRTDYDGDMVNLMPILPTGDNAQSILQGSLAMQEYQGKVDRAMLASEVPSEDSKQKKLEEKIEAILEQGKKTKEEYL
jgi:hypothetical protein